jgi:hypothetical protein
VRVLLEEISIGISTLSKDPPSPMLVGTIQPVDTPTVPKMEERPAPHLSLGWAICPLLSWTSEVPVLGTSDSRTH